MREEDEEIGDICQEKNAYEIQEDGREETHRRHKEPKDANIGSRKRRREEEDHDSEADECM